jgi:hypothetical protein
VFDRVDAIVLLRIVHVLGIALGRRPTDQGADDVRPRNRGHVGNRAPPGRPCRAFEIRAVARAVDVVRAAQREEETDVCAGERVTVLVVHTSGENRRAAGRAAAVLGRYINGRLRCREDDRGTDERAGR